MENDTTKSSIGGERVKKIEIENKRKIKVMDGSFLLDGTHLFDERQAPSNQKGTCKEVTSSAFRTLQKQQQ